MPSKISKNVRSQSVIPSKTVSNHAYTQGFQKTLCKSVRLYLNVLGYRTILDNALLTYTDFYLKKQLHHRYKICKITSETLLSLKILSKKKKADWSQKTRVSLQTTSQKEKQCQMLQVWYTRHASISQVHDWKNILFIDEVYRGVYTM